MEHIKLYRDVSTMLSHGLAGPGESLCVKPLMQQWYQAKRFFIEKFGGTYVRSQYPVKITLTPEQKEQYFLSCLDELEDFGLLTKEITTFLEENEAGFFENRVVTGPANQTRPKISRTLKHFIKDVNKLRIAQDLISKYIQLSKVEGYIYLSVDPRDFLSMSDNNEKWISCHSLATGSSKRGALSLMVDPTTIVAFVAGPNIEKLNAYMGDISWYSKRWRTLLHTDGCSCVYFNKGYPFQSEGIMPNLVAELQEHLFAPSVLQVQSYDVSKTKDEFQKNIIKVEEVPTLVEDLVLGDELCGYCDISYGNIDTLYVAQPRGQTTLTKIKIGAYPKCPVCGGDFLSSTADKIECDYCL